MRKAGLTLVALLVSLVVSVPAFAVIGALDDVPAATLFLPNFEVDLNNPNGVTTLFTINNGSEAPAIAHVTLWTDLSVPTMTFDVYLTGFDVHTLNLRDLFNGFIPGTSHSNGAISPVGDFSLQTNPTSGVGPASTSCNGLLPVPPLPATFLAHVRAAHTGGPSTVFAGQCSGVNHGDNIARGYITIDNMNQCTLAFPSDPGYFALNGTGLANNLNQLWGDYFYVDSGNNFAQGFGMVHLEASNTLNGSANYTFYRRYSANDQREGLPSTWATRYANGGSFDGGSLLVVWRDSKRTIVPFACAGPKPAPFPLGQTQVVVFDESENPSIPASQSPPFRWETNRTVVGGVDLPVANNFGWLYLNLNTAVSSSQVPFEPAAQSYVSIVLSALGRFSVGYAALALDNVTTAVLKKNVVLPTCDGAPDPAACP